jgi:hypothetical protein
VQKKGSVPLQNFCVQPFDRFTGSTEVNSAS